MASIDITCRFVIRESDQGSATAVGLSISKRLQICIIGRRPMRTSIGIRPSAILPLNVNRRLFHLRCLCQGVYLSRRARHRHNHQSAKGARAMRHTIPSAHLPRNAGATFHYVTNWHDVVLYMLTFHINIIFDIVSSSRHVENCGTMASMAA